MAGLLGTVVSALERVPPVVVAACSLASVVATGLLARMACSLERENSVLADELDRVESQLRAALADDERPYTDKLEKERALSAALPASHQITVTIEPPTPRQPAQYALVPSLCAETKMRPSSDAPPPASETRIFLD